MLRKKGEPYLCCSCKINIIIKLNITTVNNLVKLDLDINSR